MTPPAVKCNHCDFQIEWESYTELAPVSAFTRSVCDALNHYRNTEHNPIAVEIFINAEPTGGIFFELDMFDRQADETIIAKLSNFYRSLERLHHF